MVDLFDKKYFDITLLHGKKINNDYHYKWKNDHPVLQRNEISFNNSAPYTGAIR